MDTVEQKTLLRTDSWTPQEDQLLVQLVLDAIRERRTQLYAFKEAAQQLNRTPGACGFRWNGLLRHNYRIEVADAKRERRTKIETPIQTRTQHPVRKDSSIAIQEAIVFLEGISREYQALRQRVHSLTIERDRLRTRVYELEQNLRTRESETPPTPEQIQRDAQLLAQIAIRARKVLGEK